MYPTYWGGGDTKCGKKNVKKRKRNVQLHTNIWTLSQYPPSLLLSSLSSLLSVIVRRLRSHRLWQIWTAFLPWGGNNFPGEVHKQRPTGRGTGREAPYTRVRAARVARGDAVLQRKRGIIVSRKPKKLKDQNKFTRKVQIWSKHFFQTLRPKKTANRLELYVSLSVCFTDITFCDATFTLNHSAGVYLTSPLRSVDIVPETSTSTLRPITISPLMLPTTIIRPYWSLTRRDCDEVPIWTHKESARF